MAPSFSTFLRAEHWSVDAADRDVAVLDIPPVLGRERVFDIDLRFSVRSPVPGDGAWLSVALDLDGAREWARRIEVQCPGQTDSLDFHCRRVVPEGQALRLRATAQAGGGARRHRLRLDAEEQPHDQP
jgi:hypothetical protein